ncbi:MAG: ABC transporter permease [Phycisphaerae bacterium]|nr:ABC transporter permease [Phycisphaerae bacterium]MCZ2400007.1 ABC transporter permease [Phycisphaerae bacterium]
MMRHWSGLATRNWHAKQVRSGGAVAAIALGVAAVVWVTCCYESVRASVMEWATGYIGAAQITVQSPLGKYDTVPARLVDAIAQVEGVAQVNGTLVQRLRVAPVSAAERGTRSADTLRWSESLPEVDLRGIDLRTELAFRQPRVSAGRMLSEEDEYEIVLDSGFAEDFGLALGDSLFVWGASQERAFELRIVGLMRVRRVGRFQKGQALMPLATLQRINSKTGQVTAVDVRLTEATPDAVALAQSAIRSVALRILPNAVVRSVEGRMRQIQFAQRQQEFVLMVASCVVMLTALVTILSTLSMGMIERISQLGLMRCVGLTGGQLSCLMLLEVLPLGLVGILTGLPLGLAMTGVTVWLVPEYVGQFVINPRGLLLATGAGLATTLTAALLPMIAALTVSPMEAAHPRARPAPAWVLLLVFVLGAGGLAVQHFGLLERVLRSADFFFWASLALVLLYVSYALLAPVVMRVVGAPGLSVVSGLLGVARPLLAEQVGRAVWRSAGVCCGLMVGLSLIVAMIVINESVVGGWQFPKEFPEAYVWSFEQMPDDAAARIAGVPGVGSYTVANAHNAIVRERKPMFMAEVLLSVTWFVGCDPETFFRMVRVEMIEGTLEGAVEKLKEGGHVVVADDFARSRDKGLGDEVTVFIGNRTARFRIAGVMASPALDIAAGYFQAQSEFIVAASGSVLGTRADMERHFGITGAKLILLNFDLPPEPVPPGWPPPRAGVDRDGLSDHLRDERVPLERRWQSWREQEVLRQVRRALEAPQAYIGTARELKDEIDRELVSITRLLSTVPSVALLVAALGVANLMAANVTARMRQIAILRAVGGTQDQVLRLVVGEALLVGLLGCAMGLALGLHVSSNIITLVDRMWGFRLDLQLPWATIAFAVALTILLCMLAGLLPARYAARANVVEALRRA